MEAYAGSYQYQLTDDARKLLIEMLNVETINGNGRFATNLVDEMIQAQAMRLMSREQDQDLAAKALFLEEEDIRNAIQKVTNMRG
jgi:hypothetical protein